MFLFLVDSPEIVGCQECATPHVERRSNYSRVECGFASDGESDVDDADIVIGEQVSVIDLVVSCNGIPLFLFFLFRECVNEFREFFKFLFFISSMIHYGMSVQIIIFYEIFYKM